LAGGYAVVIDKTGPRFETAAEFSEGLAMVLTDDD
jgi:hypothetical protein